MAIALINEDEEHVRASYWRRRIVLLKIDTLAAEIGYAGGVIYRFERGENSLGTGPPPANAWRRYKLCCAALHARIHGWTKGREFDWRL